MSIVLRILFSATLTALCAEGVTPVEKVVKLLEDLKTEVEGAGTSEATTYDEFACFCKTTTATKSTAIKGSHDKIDQLSADIGSNVALKETKEADLLERKKKQEELGLELEETTNRCQKEALDFEAKIAELTKAVGSLDKAITALKGSKPAFLQQRDALQQASESLALADVLGFTKHHENVHLPYVMAFLQKRIDPDDPSYKFHSAEIITTLEDMKTDFSTKKGDEESERDAAKTTCDGLKSGLTTQMGTNSGAMDTLKSDIGGLKTTIGTDRSSLITEESTLKDDSLYIHDLTERCEVRARDWDQRSASRADELKALAEALVILKDGRGGKKSVTELDAVNNRSVFLQPALRTEKVTSHVSLASRSDARVVTSVTAHSFLQSHGGVHTSSHELSAEHAAEILRQAGNRLKSKMLSSASAKIMADPFGKVKQLIQNLIERLLQEAAQEATKKGFCDTEVGKAKNNRDARAADITALTAAIHELEARKGELNESITELNDTIPELYSTLNDTRVQRAADKADNLETTKLSKEGVKAVAEAITVLQVYYKKAKSAKVLLQASPVDDDTTGPGFSGAYRGGQDKAGGIIGLLQVIKSDFDRTGRHTTQAEKEAQAEFVKFERTSKVDIAAKEQTLQLDTQELEAVGNKIDRKMGDLTTAQTLLDDALRSIEDLKPMCIDTSMTYSERTAKRDEEIAALNTALTALTPTL